MEPPLAPSINSRSRSLIASVNRPGVGLALIARGPRTIGSALRARETGFPPAHTLLRLALVAQRDAREMIRSLATFPLLDGYRGAPRAAVGDLEDVLLRVSAMSDAHPEISELDLNPVIVGTDGAVIVDARVRVEARPPKRPSPSHGQ